MEKIISRKCVECRKVKPVRDFRDGLWLSTICVDCRWKGSIIGELPPLLNLDAPKKIKKLKRIKLPIIKIISQAIRQYAKRAPYGSSKPRERNPEERQRKRNEYLAVYPERSSRSRETRKSRELAAGGSHIPWIEWSRILKKYGAKCLCCGAVGVKLTQDHVLPVSKGGKTVPENIQPLCRSCNSRKNGKHIDYRPF